MKKTDAQVKAEKQAITNINKYIKELNKEGADFSVLRPTKAKINELSTFSKASINRESWQQNYPKLWDTIKKAYDTVERVLVEELVWGNNASKKTGMIFYLKNAYSYRDNPIDNEEKPQVVIQLGENHGKNKI